MGGHKLVCDLIRSHGGRLDMENAAKALAQAANEGDINRILLLIENGVPVDETDYDGRTALHLAATEGLLLSAYILIYRCELTETALNYAHQAKAPGGSSWLPQKGCCCLCACSFATKSLRRMLVWCCWTGNVNA